MPARMPWVVFDAIDNSALWSGRIALPIACPGGFEWLLRYERVGIDNWYTCSRNGHYLSVFCPIRSEMLEN